MTYTRASVSCRVYPKSNIFEFARYDAWLGPGRDRPGPGIGLGSVPVGVTLGVPGAGESVAKWRTLGRAAGHAGQRPPPLVR